jgi:hypothetical protein
LIPANCQFDVEVDLRRSDGEPHRVAAILNAVRNGVFELRSTAYIAPGTRLQMRTQEQSFDSRVVCCERQAARSFRVALVIAGDEEKRLQPRVAVDFHGILRIHSTLLTMPVRIIDISSTGFGFELSSSVPVGAFAQLELSGGIAKGEIRHCAKNLDRYRAGMRMHEFVLQPNVRLVAGTSDSQSAISALVRSIEERQSRYETILFSLAHPAEKVREPDN